MSKHFQLDSHKLQYHPRLVADFLDGKPIVPLNAEISITDACNHRCLFCNFNYLGHKQVRLPAGRMQRLAREMAEAGVRTMTFGGAGEPLLHQDVLPSLRIGKQLGMELALSTNGVLLKPEEMEELPDLLTWVRFSINGGTPQSYAAVHTCAPEQFATTMRNLETLCAKKAARNSEMTLGTQCVVIDENYRDIETLAKRVKEAGAEYFVVKHFYPREESEYLPSMSFRTPEYLNELHMMAKAMSTPDFYMTVRDVEKLSQKRTYQICRGLPFLVYIGENGLLYTCFSHHEDEKTAIGNLLESDFASVWNSPGRTEAMHYINTQYNKDLCQANCRHHQINLWLRQLSNPPPHANFI